MAHGHPQQVARGGDPRQGAQGGWQQGAWHTGTPVGRTGGGTAGHRVHRTPGRAHGGGVAAGHMAQGTPGRTHGAGRGRSSRWAGPHPACIPHPGPPSPAPPRRAPRRPGRPTVPRAGHSPVADHHALDGLHGRGREPSCGEMPGAATAADPSRAAPETAERRRARPRRQPSGRGRVHAARPPRPGARPSPRPPLRQRREAELYHKVQKSCLHRGAGRGRPHFGGFSVRRGEPCT